MLPRSLGLAYMLKHLHECHVNTGEEFYVYDTVVQYEGYSGEICGENYERSVDVNFPSVDNLFWKVCTMNIFSRLHIFLYLSHPL